MTQGVLTVEHLKQVVKDYSKHDELVFDVETMGDHRGNPHRNEVFWISLATLGRADVIPCGHPVGERIPLDPDDEFHRINPANKHFQEHRINESSGRLKWFDIPEPFDEPPKQLWVSDVMDMLAPLLFSERRKICHNVKFDVGSITKYYGEIPPGPYGDTITAAKLVNENHLGGYKLGQAVKREFHFEYEKIGKEVERYPYSEAHMYSYYDSKYTWLLWQKLKPLMEREGIRHIFDLEMDLLPAILDLERKGITLDEPALDALGVEFAKEMARLKIRIDKAAGYEINLNANAQVAKLVYETLGHTCKVYTPSGQPSTASDTLDAFRKDPVVAKLGEYAKLSKLQSSFVIGLKREIHQRRIHPSLNPMGTVTGRMSCVAEDSLIEMPRNLMEYPDGIPITQVRPGDYVYAFDWQRELVLKKVKWVGQTGIRRTVVVTVENSEGHQLQLRLTPDHLVRLRNGDWRPAGSLEHRWGDPYRADGPRIMTMVRRGLDFESGYTYFFPHSRARLGAGTRGGGRNKEHRWIMKQIRGKAVSSKADVHHGDGNRSNNSLANLQVLTIEEHRGRRDLHPHWGKSNPLPIFYSGPHDYRVVEVTDGLVEPVWDMEVEDAHNFIANGINVHNCSQPNIQQIPSRSENGKRVREVFIAGRKKLLIVADLSQIELRVLAHFTQDPRLLRAYREGLDLHGLLAARVFGKDYTAIDRTYAKNGNFCVPMDTEALTRDGWKTYEQLSIGDEVAAYTEGVLTWTPVLHLWKFDDAPLLSLENNHFKAVTTPEHRWVGEHRKQYGHGKKAVRRWVRSEITTGSVVSEDRIFLSAPLDENCRLKITPDEAALIGWLWTDGSINRGTFTGKTSQSHGKKVAFRAEIFQSKADGITVVELLLKKLDVQFRHLIRPPKTSLAGEELRPVHVWAIDPAYMRDLWVRARLDELTPVQFVTHLGSSHIQCFVDACWLAEGWQDQRGALIMAQNEGPVYEAMSLAVFLTGYFPNICSNGVYKGTENFNIRFGKPYVNGTRLKKTPLPNAPVWCLNNALGSWVMRQGQQITLTGNSVLFGASAATLVRRYGFPNIKLAEQVQAGFYSTYRRVEPWKQEVFRQALKKYDRKKKVQPYVETILGRKRRLPDLHSTIRGVRSAAERKAVSSIIQGSAADYFKLAMMDCYDTLQEQAWEGHIIMTVHDELVVEVPERHADEGLAIVKHSMENVSHPDSGEPLLSLPIVADARIAKRWSEGKGQEESHKSKGGKEGY